MNGVLVRRRKVAGVLNGEPWIYPNAVISGPEQPGCYPVRIEDGPQLGWADYNPVAPIPGRLLYRAPNYPGDEALIAERFQQAVNRRLQLGFQIQGGGFRLVNGEGDGLPGLVIDLFGRHLVVDCYTAGMRDRLDLIRDLLGMMLADCPVAMRMGADAARREGVEPLDPEPATVSYAEHSVIYEFELGADQKSGGYLDQRDNRLMVAQWAKERSVLDLFAYHGGFGLSALAAGANDALAVDASQLALDVAAATASRNKLPLRTQQMDIFKEIPSLASKGPFELIICDPPKVAAKKRDWKRGVGAYRYLVDQCLRLLEVGGVLVVSSCSHAINGDDLRQILEQQGKKQQVDLDVIAVTGHPADHPWPVSFQTGRYLSTIAVEKRGAW